MFDTFDAQFNFISDWLYSSDSSPVMLAAHGSNGINYIAHEAMLLSYNSTGMISGSGLNLDPIAMQYDPFNNALFVLDESALQVLDSNAGAELQSIPVPGDAVDFFLLYNK